MSVRFPCIGKWAGIHTFNKGALLRESHGISCTLQTLDDQGLILHAKSHPKLAASLSMPGLRHGARAGRQ